MVSQDFRVSAAWVLPFAAIALAIAIFIADTITDLDIACPVFYTAVVLIAARFCNKREVVFVGSACIALTLLSDLLTIEVAPSHAGVINTCISLVAIAATTYLAVKLETEKEATFEARSQLAHVARVTTLGGMTTNIAHEVNQPLTAVLVNGNACLHWLDAKPPDLNEARKNITNIVRDANRASKIVVQVRDLTKGLPPVSDLVMVNEIILATTGLIDRELRQDQISIQTQLSDDVPPIKGDRVQLQQVLLNLLLNSIEALRLVAVGSRRLVIASARKDSNNVLISVHDTGKGISPNDIDCLFGPFYTTKSDGMGIGLTISRSIVESHGGRIWATPNSPRGAVFNFTLPIEVRGDRPINKNGFRWENVREISEEREIAHVHLNSRLNVP
jgi:C4-dicarboxylate-specific signal transduction histidine kinase